MRRAMLVAVVATLLRSCGGGGGASTTAGSGTPPANSQAIVLLARNPTGNYVRAGIAVGPDDTLFVANDANATIFKLTQDGVVSDFVGKDGLPPGTDGTGSAAGFTKQISKLLFDKNSQVLYALDGSEYRSYDGSPRIALRRITLDGVTSTMSLSTFPTHAPPNRLLPQNLGDNPYTLALSPDGTLYATTTIMVGGGSSTPATGSHEAQQRGLRTVDRNGGGRLLFVQESGSVVSGYSDPSPPVTYQYPTDLTATAGMLGEILAGLAVDHAGNAYISDYRRHIIVKVTPGGSASIFAGTADKPGAADGAGTAAQFNGPGDMVIDKADNLYVVDGGNQTIRKITPSGAVSTVVGQVGLWQTRPGPLPGGINNPGGLAIDDKGRLYVTVSEGVVRVQLP
jgi:streptogramin lyase